MDARAIVLAHSERRSLVVVVVDYTRKRLLNALDPSNVVTSDLASSSAPNSAFGSSSSSTPVTIDGAKRTLFKKLKIVQ